MVIAALAEANFVSLPFRLLALLESDGHRIASDVEAGRLDAEIASRLPPATVVALESSLGGGDAARAAEIRAALGDNADPGLAKRLCPPPPPPPRRTMNLLRKQNVSRHCCTFEIWRRVGDFLNFAKLFQHMRYDHIGPTVMQGDNRTTTETRNTLRSAGCVVEQSSYE